MRIERGREGRSVGLEPTVTPSRRSLLTGALGLAAGALGFACSKSDPLVESKKAYAALNELDAAPGTRSVEVLEWSFASDAGPSARAAVILPKGKTQEKFPVLVALHGRGEARKGPELGALGWPRDYALTQKIRRLSAPPLTNEDFEGFVTPKRLAEHNTSLAKDPYKGVVVVCPYLPDLDLKSALALRDYGDYLVRVVLPRARRELPVLASRGATGIDGVSLGGAVALRAGLLFPDEFAQVGSLQAAIDDPQIPELVSAAKAARAKQPTLKLRLLTSENDYFRRVVTATSQAMRAESVEHELLTVPGPHDYPFNRGPGAIEMMLWHDRGLSRV
jgi:hypothetical protein